MILKIFISRKGNRSVQGELIFSIIFLNFFLHSTFDLSPSIPLKIYDIGEASREKWFMVLGAGAHCA